MTSIAILPWLRIEHEIALNEFRLVPIDRFRYPFTTSDEGVLMNRIMSAYYVAEKAPLKRATIVAKVGQSLTTNLTEDEGRLLFDYIELLACAALSARAFFSPHTAYCNRDNFRLAIFHISGADQGMTYATKRRDGSINHMTSTLRFRKPDHVDCNWAIEIDQSLLNTLFTVQSLTPVPIWWNQVFEAIQSFNLANTDNETIRPPMELISLVSAFQRLLDTDSNEARLISEFKRLTVPIQTIDKSDPICTRFADPTIQIRVASMNKLTTVREVWLRDLCNLRGNMAHGKIGESYKPIWSIRNHLLLATYIFPLLLKSFLAQHGVYTLTDEDHFGIDLFERLTCEEHFAVISEDIPHPWNTVRHEARLTQLTDQLASLFAQPATSSTITPQLNS